MSRRMMNAEWLCAAGLVALTIGGGSLRAQDSDFRLDLH